MSALRAATTRIRPAPWDNIYDFACHRSFCGVALYPRQITLLRLIFLETDNMTAYDIDVIEQWRSGFTRRRDVFGVQPDIWERVAYLKARGARHFPHVQFVGGRRGSKGLNGGILGCEQLAYFYSLDDWQAHYGVDVGKDGYIQVGATSQTQAKQQQFADIRSMVERCKYLQPAIAETKDYTLSIRTPADVRRIGELKAAGIDIEHPIATLIVQALSASAPAFRGATAFGLFLDEFAHMVFGTGSVKSGDEIYEDAHPSLDQFDLDALTYIPTSPYRKAGKAYSLYQEGSVLMSSFADDREGIGEQARHELAGLAAASGEAVEINANPTMLVIQLPSWGLYTDWERGKELIGIYKKRPIQPGPEHESQLRRKLRNPEKFMVERCVDPGTRILCADFTWRCIDDLQVGDEIIGLDENPPHDGCKQRKMRTAVVKAKFDSYQIAYRLTLDDGTSVVCSADHRWLSTSGTTTESARWRKLSPGRTGPRTVLKVGDHLRWLVDPWEIDESKEAGYLAGLMDGEGTMHEGGGRGGWSLTWSQLPGEVADEALRILKEKGFEAVLRRDSDPLAGQWHEKYLRTRSAGRSWAVQGFAETMRFVGSIGGVKMRRQATGMWEGKGLPKPRKYGRSYKEIVSIEELPPQRLVDIETSTATFIAEGLVSHNCAQWAEVEGAYLDPGVVDRLFMSPEWLGPLEAQGRGYLYHRYRIHADPGKTGANFALCVGHLENTPCELCGVRVPYGKDTKHVCLDPAVAGSATIRPHAVIDLLRVWKPQDFPPDPETGVPTINYVTVQREIESILTVFPSTTKMSFDQWNSAGSIHFLREKFSPHIRIAEATFTERENFVRFERVKAALNLGWVSSYRDTYYEDAGSLLEMELRFLQDKGGRIVKQEIGPVTTKDLVDAFSVVVADLLHDALERFGNTGRVALTTGSSNVAALRSGREAQRLPTNEARRKLASLYGDRRDQYVPSRSSSIKTRDMPRRRPERVPVFKGRR